MVQKIGCGKRIQIGYNKILDCPITQQCGMTKEYGKIVYCDDCKRIIEGKGNFMKAKEVF